MAADSDGRKKWEKDTVTAGCSQGNGLVVFVKKKIKSGVEL